MVLEEKHEIISFIHMDVKRSGGSQDRFFFFQKHLGRSPGIVIYVGSLGSSVQVFSAVTHL